MTKVSIIGIVAGFLVYTYIGGTDGFTAFVVISVLSIFIDDFYIKDKKEKESSDIDDDDVDDIDEILEGI